MSVPVLPHLSIPAVVLAVLLYFTVGLAYLALVGAELPDGIQPASGSGGPLVRTAVAVLTLTLALVLWPAAPLLRATRSGPARRLEEAWCSWAQATAERAVALAARRQRTHRAAEGPVSGQVEDLTGSDGGKLDFPGSAARLRDACEQHRLIDAVLIANELVDDVTRRCGPGHPQVLDAKELLAHVAHLVGDETRAARLYVHVAERRAWQYGYQHPGVQAAMHNAYASWLSASGQAALITGFLLLPCLRMVAGSTAPITTASEYRLRSLQQALGSGRYGL